MSELKFTSCAYHQDKAAVSICERCKSPICLEDKRVYHRKIRSKNSSYSVRKEFCVICNATQRESDVTAQIVGGLVFIGIVILIFGVFISQITSSVNNFNSNPIVANNPNFGTTNPVSNFTGIFIFFIVIVILMLGGAFIYAKSQAEEATDEANRFKRSLASRSKTNIIKKTSRSLKENLTPLYLKKKSVTKMNCFQCGHRLYSDDLFCSNCGDSTKDEFKY